MSKHLIFIHGLGLGVWVFHHFLPWFQRLGFITHTVNLPGHQPSATAQQRQQVNLEQCVNCVQQYLTQYVNGPYVIIGLSLGGAICQQLLVQNRLPGAAKGVVLLSSVPPKNNLIFTLRFFQKLAHENADGLVDFFRNRINPIMMFSPATMRNISKQQQNDYMGKVMQGFSRLELEIFFQNILEQPCRAYIPIKIINGKEDPLFPPEVAQFTAACYQQKAEIVVDSGHLIPIAHNHQIAMQTIQRFIREVF
ncbi:alpha/beta fold hydrolase [Microbulbifer spongiae]|uniref:Alpha/beta hydrolase n=1 Tax=Microbulbifer spongiae TaxID=2944933 RepID=A0ABY9E923_9GAMM|nr:alpha/beta fold hydrolase [Microbulbifer sp. MI-G]WKD49182.1 alpha/beta hydrolase [Microbulbifer sp. MI-G]